MIFLAKQIFKTINCTVLFHTSVSKCKLSSNTVKINNNIPSTFNIIAKIIQYKNITNEIDSSTKMILDTGTTKHMSCLLDLSTSLTKVMDCYTTLGDGTTKLPVMGKGTIKIYIESHVVELQTFYSYPTQKTFFSRSQNIFKLQTVLSKKRRIRILYTIQFLASTLTGQWSPCYH